MHRVLLVMLSLVLAVPPTVVGDAGEEGLFYLREGEVSLVDGPLIADRVVIEGTLLSASQPLTIVANDLTLGAVAAIYGQSGERGGSATGTNAIADEGEAGGDVIIVATSVELGAGAVIAAGSGGAGGDARGVSLAIGGDGGQGGSVFISAVNVDVRGTIAPGRGGDGGDADASNSGARASASENRAVGGAGGRSGEAYVNGIPWMQETSIPAPASSLREFELQPATAELICNYPKGRDGSSSTLGRGGNGGNACVSAEGAPGARGANGDGGVISCDAGGNGSSGSDAVGGDATGGVGGYGARGGGHGGSAEADGYGGRGGDGGDGGNKIGANCPGGNGGRGGAGTGGVANGGRGGDSTCGHGGDGGSAVALGVGGAGGSGGPGNPAGQAGLSGPSMNGAAFAGTGGAGPGTCAPSDDGKDEVPSPIGSPDIPPWLTPGGMPNLPEACIQRLSLDVQPLVVVIDPPVHVPVLPLLYC